MGQGVPQDYAEALSGFASPLPKGMPRRSPTSASCTHKGQGVPQDYAEAVKWYRLAAAQGYAKAQYNLGIMYDNGQGVPQDYAEALKWYRLAAAQGDAEAQFNLGIMYAKGQGVPQDYAEAPNGIASPPLKGMPGAVHPRRHVRQWRRRPAGLCPSPQMVQPCCGNLHRKRSP